MTTVCIVIVKGEPSRIYTDSFLETLVKILFKDKLCFFIAELIVGIGQINVIESFTSDFTIDKT